MSVEGCQFLAPESSVVVGVKKARAAIEEEIDTEDEESEETEGGEGYEGSDEGKSEAQSADKDSEAKADDASKE